MSDFIRKPSVKISAFVISVVSIVLSVLSLLGTTLCMESGVYSGQQEENGIIQSAFYNSVGPLFRGYVNQGSDWPVLHYNAENTNFRFTITPDEGTPVTNICSGEQMSHSSLYYFSYVMKDGTGLCDYSYGRSSSIFTKTWDEYDPRDFSIHTMTIQVGVVTPFIASDSYSLLVSSIEGISRARFALIWTLTAGLILFIIGNAVMIAGCGRQPGKEEVVSGWQEKIPLDIYLFLFGGSAVLLFTGFVYAISELSDDFNYFYVGSILGLAALLLGALLAEMLIASVAVRLKMGKWWKNTLIFKVVSAIWNLMIRLWKKIFGGTVQTIHTLFMNLPLLWKGIAAVAAILFLEFFMTLAVFGWGGFFWIVLWFCYNIAILAGTGSIMLQLRKIREGGREMARGNLDYRIEEDGMIFLLKEHSADLNAIGEGMAKAVDQRMRSERMKTELITNVSHDIKTPLTSIVNYVDLLSKEAPENERMKEYIEALSRQSRRLRKLIEDLVEASKASTGNLSVDLQPCELGVLIEQTAGEYQERLEQNGLSLVVEAPETPVQVMADSRRIWRVLDNLMGNICKYALSGTRVYMTLEKSDCARLTLRNISRDRLGMSPEELTERFVRGDSSRSTEGSGLGLSIAKSLMELQHGSLKLKIDGDLFKAIVELPLMEEEKTASQQQEKESEQ